MKQNFLKNKKVLAGIAACALIGVLTMSFQNNAFGPLRKLDTLTETQDTIPEKNNYADDKMTIKDFDNLLLNMDKEMVKVKNEISKIDMGKIQAEINESINKVDFDKINMDIDKAIKEIDFSKIEKEVNSALKTVEWNKVNDEVKNSLREAKKEIEKIDMEKVKKEMEKAKLEIQKSGEEIKKINMDDIMKNARESITKAKEDLNLKKEMFNEMERDGLIDQKEGFTIDYKDKTLIINGKKQSESITEKYRKYIKEDSFRIQINKE